MRQKYLLWSLLGAILLPDLANALDYDDALAQGLKNSSLAAELKKQRLEIYGSQMDDTKLSNPELEYEYNIDGQEHEVTLSQPLRPSDITFARRSYRDILGELNNAESELDLLRLNHETARAYYSLYVLQERKNYKQEHLNFLNKVSHIVHRSINHSNLSAAEIYAFDADILATKTDLDVLEKDLQDEQILFAQFLNVSDTKIVLKQPPMMSKIVPLSDITKNLDKNPTKRKMLELQYKQAEEQVSILAQDRYAPIISPRVVYGYNRQEKEDDIKVGLALSIPLWNHQDGAYSALKAQKKSAQLQLASLDNVSFNEMVVRAYNKLSEQNAAVNKYIQVILPYYKKSVDKMEASFAAGRFSVFDVWQIREKYLNAQEMYLNALQKSLEAKIELEILIGARLEDIQ